MDLVELWKQEQAEHWQEVAAASRRRKQRTTYTHMMDRRDPDWISAADEARQELNEHLERKSRPS